MEAGTAEPEGSSEDIAGKKKSKLKVLRTRLFGRMKRKETVGLMKQSQSTSDVTAEEAEEAVGDSTEEFLYSPAMLGSRAMSHDSIFFAEEGQAAVEPVRILSQENVQGKIKALQMKLQQQNLRLGPPPLLITGKRAEDTGVSSEDDGLPHSPPETSFSLPEVLARGTPQFPDTLRNHSSLSLAGTGSEEDEQDCPQPPSHPHSPQAKSTPPTPASPPGVDFDSPARFTPCLDTSAARHRMSVKPRNQRASAKGRRLPSDRPRSESLNDLDHPVPERDEEDTEVAKDAVRLRSYSTQVIRSGEGGVRRDPAVGKLRLSGFGVGHTDTDRRDSTLAGPPSDPSKLEGHVTMNPLFRRPIPRGPEAPRVPDLGTGETPPISAELETKNPSVSQPQGGSDPVREVLNDLARRDSQNNTLAPSATPTTAPAGILPISENNQTRARKSNVQGVTQEPVWPPRTQSLPTPPAAALKSTVPRMSLKKNTAEQAQQDCQPPQSPQSVTVPPAGSEDQPPPEGTKQQRPNSGSFRFSIASAWDRPRGGSLHGKEDKRGVKEEVLASKPEEAKPQPLNPASALKSEGGLPAKTSFVSKQEEQAVAVSEEATPQDQSRNVAVFQERTDPNPKGKESMAPSGPAWESGGGGGVRQAAMEIVGRGVEEKKDSRETQSGGLEEDERSMFGVKLRSTSLSTKYRQREVRNPEPKSQALNVEGCVLGQSRDIQSSPLGQSRDPRRCSLDQSHDPEGGLLGQSCDTQALTPTKCPDPVQMPNLVAQGSQSLRQEKDLEHACLKPNLQRKRTFPNFDPPTFPTDPRSTPSSSTKSDPRDRERPGDSKRGGPAPKPAPAPPKEAEPVSEPVMSEPVMSEPVMSEPAWMTVAREKTRSLQQLFTSRLPRNLTASTPSPAPAPASTPAPKLTPQPASTPAPKLTLQPTPSPAPTPTPKLTSQPTPTPKLTLQPAPSPAPTPTPKFTPQPTPSPAPTPTPKLTLQPTPSPAPTPTPKLTSQPAPKLTPQPAPQTPAPAPTHQPAPQLPSLAFIPGRGDRAPQGTAERTAVLQGRLDRGALPEKKKQEQTEDRRQERADRSFSVGRKTEPKAAPPDTQSTAATAPHRGEAKMEGRATYKAHTLEAAPSSAPVQSRQREDRQPSRPEVASSAPALSRGGQPSWMELAKRKSLAWSDKTMD
ncbi:CRACD-like protein [Conger conger]|uniref:CRACD-like protein n=1 Tax=Conger conger TaxID=82655 RepID=UPI002A5AB754|nr:CRACD-like protein [Conger conger]